MRIISLHTNPDIAIFIKGLDIGGLCGGADLFGANLACELHRNGQLVRLFICNRYNTDAELINLKLINEQGINPEFLLVWNGRPTVQYYLQALRKLNNLLVNHEADIIHTHFHTGSFLAILLKLSHKARRIVRTAHVDHEWKRGWGGLLKQAIIRALIFVVFPFLIDLEVGVSAYTVELLNDRLFAKLLRKRALLIPNAIPGCAAPVPVLSPSRFTGWLGDHPVIGSVGRLEQQKGYSYLIAAIPSILPIFPNLEVWLIGEGPLKGELEAQCGKLCVSEHVVFWGKRTDVPALLDRMDIFISSSVYEGLPTAVLEAMGSGVPCIVTDIAGTRDIVSDANAHIVGSMDSEALADGISLLLTTPTKRKQLVENAMKTVNRFRIDRIAKAYMEAYLKL
jgi:glycosyltransferase involved in cell wall biosynthesis